MPRYLTPTVKNHVLVMKGQSLYKIGALVGSFPEICRRHYTALIPETMADAVEFSNHLRNTCGIVLA